MIWSGINTWDISSSADFHWHSVWKTNKTKVSDVVIHFNSRNLEQLQNTEALEMYGFVLLGIWLSDCFLDVLSHLMSFHLTYRFSTSPPSTGNNSSTTTLHKLIHILIQWSYCIWNGTKPLAFKNIQQQNLKMSQVLSGFFMLCTKALRAIKDGWKQHCNLHTWQCWHSQIFTKNIRESSAELCHSLPFVFRFELMWLFFNWGGIGK